MVPPDPQARGLNRPRGYSIDELKDLQSKLTLVAGKAKGHGGKDRQEQVDYFVEVSSMRLFS